jgi:chromosome partitioning protein
MRKLAIAMAKGGVGKTTTSVNLAHALAAMGQRVLLVDCDTQGQVKKFLGVNPAYGMYEFVTGRTEQQAPVKKKRGDLCRPPKPVDLGWRHRTG